MCQHIAAHLLLYPSMNLDVHVCACFFHAMCTVAVAVLCDLPAAMLQGALGHQRPLVSPCVSHKNASISACDTRILPSAQIYTQAIIANSLMVKKVQQWALKTNGYFRLHDRQPQGQAQGRRGSRLGLGLEDFPHGQRRLSRVGLGLEESVRAGNDSGSVPTVPRSFIKVRSGLTPCWLTNNVAFRTRNAPRAARGGLLCAALYSRCAVLSHVWPHPRAHGSCFGQDVQPLRNRFDHTCLTMARTRSLSFHRR